MKNKINSGLKKKAFVFCLIIAMFCLKTGFSQEELNSVLKDSIYKESIKTVKAYKEGWDLSYPVININSDDKIKISFDDLKEDVEDYSYEIIHCDSRWRPSDIDKTDYLYGFFQNQITDYAYSINTIVQYIHYNVLLPNYDIKMLLSGNYVIKVYQNNNPDDIVFTKRFYVVDYQTEIDASCKQPEDFDKYETGQELNFTVKFNVKEIANPSTEIVVNVSQNNRWDNALIDIKPSYINNDKLEYKHLKETVFLGGNEFRNFNTKDIRYLSPEIKSIEYKPTGFYVTLHPDVERPFKPYFFEDDINGKLKIEVARRETHETDADYLKVFFNLPYSVPFDQGGVYVFGEISGWKCAENNKMKYDLEKKTYELELLLKQGYYNYEYVYIDPRSNIADNSVIEGNHYETENDYLFFVYYKDISERYDKLIGFKVINSLRKKK